jgi:uncharacterized membrane protein
VFLAVDWIVFGSMHFSLHAETRRMLPPWVPAPDVAVIATGIAEVTVGILLLYGRMRRLAAIGSILLLVLLTPAVFHILYNDGALPFDDPASLPNRLWRLLGVPHNVLMLICSVHLLRKPYPDPWRPAADDVAPRAAPLRWRGWSVLLVAFILLLCNAAGFLAIAVGVPADKPTAYMWMMMCLAFGGLLGFLFAVPRANPDAPGRYLLLPNRNIEQISDWLTKILVGLGLVNLREIGAFLAERSVKLASSLQVDADFALAMILYFAIAGFLEGYLLTRIFLQWLFVDEVRSAGSGQSGTAEAGRSSPPGEKRPPGETKGAASPPATAS